MNACCVKMLSGDLLHSNRWPTQGLRVSFPQPLRGRWLCFSPGNVLNQGQPPPPRPWPSSSGTIRSNDWSRLGNGRCESTARMLPAPTAQKDHAWALGGLTGAFNVTAQQFNSFLSQILLSLLLCMCILRSRRKILPTCRSLPQGREHSQRTWSKIVVIIFFNTSLTVTCCPLKSES